MACGLYKDRQVLLLTLPSMSKIYKMPQNILIFHTCVCSVGVGNRFNYRVSLHIFARNSIYHILRSINQNRCNFSPPYVCLSKTRLKKLRSRESYSIYAGTLLGNYVGDYFINQIIPPLCGH